MKNYIKPFMLLIGIITIITLGCARTVTTRDIELNIEFTLTFEGNIDTDKYNYLIIFSKVSSPNISLPNAYNGSIDLYFPTPGRTYLQEPLILQSTTLNDLYETYFDTWSDYIVINQGDTNLYQSDAFGFEYVSSDNFIQEEIGFSVNNNYSNGSNTIKFFFNKDFLTTSVSTIRYITFATTERKDSEQSGYFRDNINQMLELTILKNEEINSQPQINDPSIPDAAEVKSWRIRIF